MLVLITAGIRIPRFVPDTTVTATLLLTPETSLRSALGFKTSGLKPSGIKPCLRTCEIKRKLTCVGVL